MLTHGCNPDEGKLFEYAAWRYSWSMPPHSPPIEEIIMLPETNDASWSAETMIAALRLRDIHRRSQLMSLRLPTEVEPGAGQ